MKNKFINIKPIGILLVLYGCFCLYSCKKDPLDMTPNGRISLDKVFSDNDLTASYLNSVYGYIPLYGASYHSQSLLAAITDESSDANAGIIGGVLSTNWYNGALSANNLFAMNWYAQYWQGIRQANIFLDNIETATVNDPKNRSRWRGEAKVLRAFYYLELIKQFGGMPVQEESFPLDFDYTTLQRASFQEGVQFIVRNCDEALGEPDLPFRIQNPNERGRFTKAIALAIKSEALLFNASPLWNPENDPAKWENAAIGCKQALDQLVSNGYALYPDYEAYFKRESDVSNNPSDKETIFEILNPDNMRFIFVTQTIPSLAGAVQAGAGPSQELVDSYDMKDSGQPAILGYQDDDHLQPIINATSGYDETKPYEGRDPRFYATIFYNGAYFSNINGTDHYIESYVGGADGLMPTVNSHTHTGYYLRKFIDTDLRQGDGIISASKWKKYRLAEMYLNLAEAENEANGPTSTAYEAINAIRKRVQMPDLPPGLTQDEFRDRVHRERRVELAFEEHRFWDVRRWKILSETDKQVSGMRWIEQGNGTFAGSRFVADHRNAWQDRFLLFPIPLSELSKLPAFEQNPGW